MRFVVLFGVFCFVDVGMVVADAVSCLYHAGYPIGKMILQLLGKIEGNP